MVSDTALSANSVAMSSLSENTMYYWRVYAINLAGNSNWSSSWSFTTVPSAAIKSHSNLSQKIAIRQDQNGIAFYLPGFSEHGEVRILALSGKIVAVLPAKEPP